MRKSAALFLIATLSLGLTLGCAGGKSNKRARIATAAPKVSTGAQNADDKKSGEEKDADAAGSDQDPAESGAPEIKPEDSTASKDILESFESLKLNGDLIPFSDLKSVTLDLDEVIILYNNLENKDYTALASYKVQKNESNGLSLIPNGESVSAGETEDINLAVLSILDHVEFNSSGVMALENSKALDLAPEVRNKELLLNEVAGQSDRIVLERLFDDIFYLLPADESEGANPSLKASSTGTLIYTEIRKSTEALDILVEVHGEDGVQSFLLKFRLKTNIENLDQ